MRYVYTCEVHGQTEVVQSLQEELRREIPCPDCGASSRRDYRAELHPVENVIYRNQGYHKTDYFGSNMGRGKPADKKEYLNQEWSRLTGRNPPPPDSHGQYE